MKSVGFRRGLDLPLQDLIEVGMKFPELVGTAKRAALKDSMGDAHLFDLEHLPAGSLCRGGKPRHSL